MEELKHSGLGIASFIVSIAAGVCIFFTFVIAGAIEATTPGGINEESATAVVIGLLLVIFLFAALVSLGLGIGGLLQKERKKVFAILGTVFSAAIILCTVALIALGLAME